MRNQIIKIAALSIGLLLSSQAVAKTKISELEQNNIIFSHQEMVEKLTEAKKAQIDRVDFKAAIKEPKHKKYLEDPNEPFSWWEERIYRDLARNYSKLFTQYIVPNIDAVINSPSSPTSKVDSLLDTESNYREKAAILVWNNLISKRPDSKNARSAFCKVAAQTVSIARQGYREKRGEICDKNFQLDPIKHFQWTEHITPEVINSIIVAPKLK